MTPPIISHHFLQFKTKTRRQSKTFIEYVRIACATAFSKTSFPLQENNLDFQHKILFLSLSFSMGKRWDFFLPISEGRPRYISWEVTTAKLKVLLIKLTVACEASGLIKIKDFSKLFACPEAVEHLARMLFYCTHSSASVRAKIKLSLAKRQMRDR